MIDRLREELNIEVGWHLSVRRLKKGMRTGNTAYRIPQKQLGVSQSTVGLYLWDSRDLRFLKYSVLFLRGGVGGVSPPKWKLKKIPCNR